MPQVPASFYWQKQPFVYEQASNSVIQKDHITFWSIGVLRTSLSKLGSH
jgi:hypothetical protein